MGAELGVLLELVTLHGEGAMWLEWHGERKNLLQLVYRRLGTGLREETAGKNAQLEEGSHGVKEQLAC